MGMVSNVIFIYLIFCYVMQQGKYPWNAILSYSIDKKKTFSDKFRYNYGCSASLIASRWAITAAHCLGPDLEEIVFGEVDRRKMSVTQAPDQGDSYRFALFIPF